jgi:SAM-dependent methyltransferase
MPTRDSVTRIKQRARSVVESTTLGYQFLLRRDNCVHGPVGRPRALWHNAVLKTRQEMDDAIAQVRALSLPLVSDAPKNWDCLAALECVLANTSTKGRVLDAGAERYSLLLPWLCLYGYRNLDGINIAFKKEKKLGPILYKYGDVTNTGYEAAAFDAIACLSVVEHGVDLRRFFREASRILKSGGVLITSTDYWHTPIDSKGREMFGALVRVFTREETLLAIELAAKSGFTPTTSIDVACDEKVVHWKEVDLKYTLVILSFRKTS